MADTKDDGIISITLNETIKVELDFSGENDQYKDQFFTYMKMYNITDIGTLMNAQNWAQSRGVPCKITVEGYFSIYSWLIRILIPLNRYLERSGGPGQSIGPKKWGE